VTWDAGALARLRDAVQAGGTWGAIARIVGRPLETCYNMARRQGMQHPGAARPRAPPEPSPEPLPPLYEPQAVATARLCLGCGTTFESLLPPRQQRLCVRCRFHARHE
jgi:hypothetical protein